MQRMMTTIQTLVAILCLVGGSSAAHGNDGFVADLNKSTVSGIYIGDTKDALISKWGSPEGITEDKLLYPSRGASVDIIENEIHAIYLWVSETRMDEPFPELSEKFEQARVTVLSKDGRSIEISKILTKKEIISIFGKPDNDAEPYPDGSLALEYMGIDPHGSKPYLHLCFEFMKDEFVGLWMTH